MDFLLRVYRKVAKRNGQTMAEYALVMAAIAVAAYLAYFNLGDEVSELVTSLTTLL